MDLSIQMNVRPLDIYKEVRAQYLVENGVEMEAPAILEDSEALAIPGVAEILEHRELPRRGIFSSWIIYVCFFLVVMKIIDMSHRPEPDSHPRASYLGPRLRKGPGCTVWCTFSVQEDLEQGQGSTPSCVAHCLFVFSPHRVHRMFRPGLPASGRTDVCVFVCLHIYVCMSARTRMHLIWSVYE